MKKIIIICVILTILTASVMAIFSIRKMDIPETLFSLHSDKPVILKSDKYYVTITIKSYTTKKYTYPIKSFLIDLSGKNSIELNYHIHGKIK
jgi:hypothetical protein